jgi:hypothetical protein
VDRRSILSTRSGTVEGAEIRMSEATHGMAHLRFGSARFAVARALRTSCGSQSDRRRPAAFVSSYVCVLLLNVDGSDESVLFRRILLGRHACPGVRPAVDHDSMPRRHYANP